MTKWVFRERGREFRVFERMGTVEHVQAQTRTAVTSSSQSAGPYTPATAGVSVETKVTQRVFMDDGQGSKWSFDCEDDIPIRPRAQLLLRYLSTGNTPADVVYINDIEAGQWALRREPIEKLLIPTYRSLLAVWLTVILGPYTSANFCDWLAHLPPIFQFHSLCGGVYTLFHLQLKYLFLSDAQGPVGIFTSILVLFGLALIWKWRKTSMYRRIGRRLVRGPDA